MTLIFLSHLDWGGPETADLSNRGCNDRSDVSMVAEPNGKCGDSYPGTAVFQQLPNSNWNFGIEEK